MEGPDGTGVAMYLHRRGAHWWFTELAQLRTDDVWLDHNGMPHFNVLSLVDE